MFKIVYGRFKEYNKIPIVPMPDKYFDINFEEEWLEDDFSKKAIKEIDDSNLISPYVIMSEKLGQIPPQYLSGGVKTLLLVKNVKSRIFNISQCGDNCANLLLELNNYDDFYVNLNHLIDFGDKKFKMYFENTGEYVYDTLSLLKEIRKYRNEVKESER